MHTYVLHCLYWGQIFILWFYGWLSYPNTNRILFLAQHELQELGHFLAQFTKLPKIQNSPFQPIGIFIQSHRFFFSFFSFCWPQTNIFSSILWEILIKIKNAVEIQLLWVVTLILMTFFCPLSYIWPILSKIVRILWFSQFSCGWWEMPSDPYSIFEDKTS